jgi:hypothetical protein
MADNNTADWDDIHFGKEEPIVIDPNVANLEDDDIESKTFDTDDGLEASKGKNLDDDDESAQTPEQIAATEAAIAAKAAGKEPVVPVTEQSGIEQYLAQFDIEAGMIQFEDGTAKHFTELEPAKQAEILSQLHGTQASTVEDKFGLDEDEIGLLNYMRTNNLTVEQMVDSMVQEKVASMMTLQELATEDYAKMEPDALYTKFLKETSPDATPEQLAADLAKAKELSNYAKLTENLKTQFVSRQESEITAKEQEAVAEHAALVETQRQEIVNSVIPMTEIAGIALDANIKNNVLDHILQTNDEGDSAFMDEVFAEPQSLFKAAFWYVYGESIVAQRDEYWKKEKSAAYKRGKEDALGITPAPDKKTFIAKPAPGTKPNPTPARPGVRPQNPDDGEDWSTLHTQ